MALAAVSAAVGLSGVSQRNQPWVSMVAFSADMYRLWRFSMTHCASSFRGGIRQKERGWLSIVSFIPEPSGSNENRSEEHTSELQSQSNLVCRLLLEKKKRTNP